ncbi:MAG: hypothetical protein RIQ60_2623 [Pseudomonadota bacterium]|jgi:putative secretion ATPase (PEP-CTERM system associated)
MYEAHFGLSGQPFQLNPDPAFYFNSRGHGHALAYLRYGVTQGEGFIVVTGEIGAGKTTLVRTLLGELDRQHVVAAQIVSTQLDAGDLLQAITTSFGIPAQGASKAYMIATLEAFLTTLAAQGRRALLIVDEAQNLNRGAVEELRMLSNFQLGNHTLLQSFLVGQPELRRILEAPDMEQLRQRISASCHLGPLDPDETRAYVEHRLHRVGWSGRPAISPGGFDQLYRWSGGVPRRINRLANRVLLATFLDNRSEVDAALVEHTARELRSEIGDISAEPAPLLPRAGAVVPPGLAPASDAPIAQTSATSVHPPLPPTPVAEPTTTLAATDATTEVTTRATTKTSAPAPQAPHAPSGSGNASTSAQTSTVAPVSAPAGAAAAAPSTDDSGDLPFADLASLQQLGALDEVERHGVSDAASVQTRYLLALTDTPAGALKLAALGRALSELPDAPALLLVTPGLRREAWPWDEMERLLPRPPLALHLGLPTAGFEQITPLMFERFGQVLGEFHPTAVLVAGASDSLLAGALLAHKRGLPLARLDTGDSELQSGDHVNRQLIDPLAQRRFDCLHGGSITSARLADASDVAHGQQIVPGSLLADVCQALEPGITSATGACLRNNLSMYLGPDWSSEVQGTPYAAVALSLSGTDTDHHARRIEQLLASSGSSKLLWLVDGPTEAALRAWQALQAQQARQGEEQPLADRLFMVGNGSARSDARDRRRLAEAQVFGCRISSLTDQLSLLRGALALVSESGQLLGEVARLWQLPCALVQSDGRWLAAEDLGAEPPSVAVAMAPTDDLGLDRAGAFLQDAHALGDWLADLAHVGYAARAAHAAIHAAATAAGARAANNSGPAAPEVPGAAAALAHELSHWLQLYTPAHWALEA